MASKAFRGFPLGIELSVGLHILVVLILIGIWHIHPRGMLLPAPNNAFEHAIAVSLTPPPKPQPKPPVPTPPKPITPKPVQPAIATEAKQAAERTTPPVKNPPPPSMPQQQPQPEQQANPDYEQMAMQILEEHKRYPREALLSGTEGSVELTFIVNNQGTVLGFNIQKPSGSEPLDNEVRRLIHSVHFPPFPPGDPDLRKTLTVTIQFTLKGNVGP